MIEDQYKKHSRRTALAAYQEFKIHKSDEDLIKKVVSEEESTQLTLSTQSPTDRYQPQLQSEVLETMESIQNRIKLQIMCNDEKRRSLKCRVLNLFFKKPSTSTRRLGSKKNSEDVQIKKPSKKKSSKRLTIKSSKSKSLKDLKFFETQHSTRSLKHKSVKLSSID